VISLREKFEAVKRFNDYNNQTKTNADSAMQLKDQLEKAQERICSFNSREAVFKKPISTYEDI